MFSSDLEGHDPSRPSTACDFGGPRSVVAVCPVLTDATAARRCHLVAAIGRFGFSSPTAITGSSVHWLTRTGLLRPKRIS